MFVPKTIERLFGRIVRSIAGVDEKKLYGLDHAILNIEVPPRCMWMNMGYWKVCKTCQISASLSATLISENGLIEKIVIRRIRIVSLRRASPCSIRF